MEAAPKLNSMMDFVYTLGRLVVLQSKHVYINEQLQTCLFALNLCLVLTE